MEEELGNNLLLEDVDFQRLCKELLRSGEISSDGELSDIARHQIGQQTNDINVASELVRRNVASWIKEEQALLHSGVPDNPTTGSNPCTETYPGPLGFEVSVNSGSKSKEAHFSETLQKIYINQNRFVNIEFRLSNVLPDSSPISGEIYVRALCVYLQANDFITPVKVCYTHSRDSSGSYKSDHAEHLVRCSHPSSVYNLDPISGRHSVITPFPEQQSGSRCSTLAYKFMDLGSCSGGLNRRETALIFTLEDNTGKVIGRQLLHLRICTCPRRDFEQDRRNWEKQQKEGSLVTTSLPSPPLMTTELGELGEEKQQQFVQGGKRKAYWVLAHGEENFHALKAIGETLEKKDGGDVKKWSESVKRFNEWQQSHAKPKKLKPTTTKT